MLAQLLSLTLKSHKNAKHYYSAVHKPYTLKFYQDEERRKLRTKSLCDIKLSDAIKLT